MKSYIKNGLYGLTLLVVSGVSIPASAQLVVGGGIGVGVAFNVPIVTVAIRPPALPVYIAPPRPIGNYYFTPGYWEWDGGWSDYYWVPGVWVQPPQIGFLWTPGYWGWTGGNYGWYGGYWGPTLGFYGGISYGFGYNGSLNYGGGSWSGSTFNYNQVVMNNTTINNYYGFNGPGGVTTVATAQQLDARRGVAPISAQVQQVQAARTFAASNPAALRASMNGGHPAIAAAQTAGNFKTGVVAANGANAKVVAAVGATPHGGKAAAAAPSASAPAAAHGGGHHAAPAATAPSASAPAAAHGGGHHAAPAAMAPSTSAPAAAHGGGHHAAPAPMQAPSSGGGPHQASPTAPRGGGHVAAPSGAPAHGSKPPKP
jgi:hypothetical protein